MLLNCGGGEDSWESFGLQGDPISPSWRKSVLNIHWKDWCWSWNSHSLASWCEEVTHLQRSWDAGKNWRWEEKGTTEDEMAGWHHWLNGHESGSWWWTGNRGMLQSMGSERVGHDWATELNWIFCWGFLQLGSSKILTLIILFFWIFFSNLGIRVMHHRISLKVFL